MSNAPIFETLGCRLNTYETEAMKALSREAELDGAVIVNTCAVTAEAVRQAKQKIRRLRREHPDRQIVVTGCAAQVEPETFAAMAEVDQVVGNREKLEPETWQGLARNQLPEIRVQDIMDSRKAPAPMIDGFGTRARAYVQVQTGCDHRCTFCIIPYGRGNSRSVPSATVVEQVKRLAGSGFKEVVLTGVDMTSWGADLEGEPRLGDLVRAVLDSVPDLPRLRISSIDSIEVDPALHEALISEPRLMPHLHLSLQAGDDMILKRMKRRHLRDDSIDFCGQLAKARPEVVFGADLIAGFPTETEAMFENTLNLISECGLTWLHVFPYSIRQGTPAARMPQVPRHVIRDRAARLRAQGEARVARYLSSQHGKVHRVLMESPRMGRTEGFAPVHFETPQAVGEIVSVKIAGNNDGALLAST